MHSSPTASSCQLPYSQHTKKEMLDEMEQLWPSTKKMMGGSCVSIPIQKKEKEEESRDEQYAPATVSSAASCLHPGTIDVLEQAAEAAAAIGIGWVPLLCPPVPSSFSSQRERKGPLSLIFFLMMDSYLISSWKSFVMRRDSFVFNITQQKRIYVILWYSITFILEFRMEQQHQQVKSSYFFVLYANYKLDCNNILN